MFSNLPNGLLANSGTRTLFILAISTSFWLVSSTLAQGQLWIKQFGTAEVDGASALAIDGTGGVFVSGVTDGSLASPNLGNFEVFIAHYDDQGNQIWIRQIGTKYGTSYPESLMPDSAGGVYVAGFTSGTLGGPNPWVSGEIFVAHYDKSGNQTWINQFGTIEHDYLRAIATDGIGGMYLAGYTDGAFVGKNRKTYDIFIMHWNSEHKRTWVKQIHTEQDDRAFALAPDGTGGVYLGGTTRTGIIHEVRKSEAVLAHYDITGARTWLRQFGTETGEGIRALATDGAGGVYAAGYTSGNLGGIHKGNGDCFITHYKRDGTRSWITMYGTPESDSIRKLAPDGIGGVFATGFTRGSLGGTNLGPNDVYLIHFDRDGVQSSIVQFGSDQNDRAYGLAPDGSSGVYIAGSTEGSLAAPHLGNGDVFIARHIAICKADCDQSTGLAILDVFDFLCFQASYISGDPYACDCNTQTGIGVCDVFDFLCFQSAFLTGCS